MELKRRLISAIGLLLGFGTVVAQIPVIGELCRSVCTDIPEQLGMHSRIAPVEEPGRVTYTVDDIIFADDPLWPSRWGPDRRNGRGGDGLGDPSRDDAGVWHIKNDIVLGENIAGYDAAWKE